MTLSVRLLWLAVPLVALGSHTVLAADDGGQVDPAAAKFFETKIRPLLVERCYECHGPDSEAAGGLRVDSRAALLAGGERGPAFKPGDPKDSLLIDAVNHGNVVQMPPKSKLSPAAIADLTAWVASGAPWPGEERHPATQAKPVSQRQLTDEERNYWAFQPPAEPTVPAVKDTAWPAGSLDHFVLAPLEAAKLRPAPPATKHILIRRATFDLHGLPPTPEEVDAFLADDRPEAFARVVDRLLASPRYGERWGRRWLDLARYADSNGMDENMAMAEAWRYRDWVIAAFNADKPYDEFVCEQLAGDLLPSPNEATRQARLVATGFLVLGPKMLAEDDPVKMEMDIIDEQIDTIGRTFLGLTLGCARCHDHKFDPISTADYYSLAGIFKSTKTMENHRVVAMWSERPLASAEEVAQLAAHDASLAKVKAELNTLQDQANKRLVSESIDRTADYLLAAAARRQRLWIALAAELNSGNVDAGSLVVEAESFQRGNVLRDTANYGAGIGVILNAGPTPNVADYDFELPAAGTYQLALRYAAAEPRPIEIALDGKPLATAANSVTGSWQPDTQRWTIVATIPLASGRHVLHFEREGAFPHLDKWALLPARFSPDAAGRATPDPLASNMVPAFVNGWRKYLEHTAADPQSIMHLWHAWQRADELGQPLAVVETAPLAAALLAAPRPQSLAELAARYKQLFRAAHDAVGDRPQPLDNPALEAFRQVLVDKEGPWAISKQLHASYPKDVRDTVDQLTAKRDELERTRPRLNYALAVADQKPQNLRVHLRGSHLTLGDEAPRQFPRVLAGDTQASVPADRSGRLELAQWLTRADHPLTSRVMVNRLWQGHFGEGLVRSGDNFGKLGERPDNAPLLDWLARRFVDSGWSVKAMHRLLMLSRAYQMSTALDAQAAQVDPENRLLWRANRRRLEAEEIRDSILAVSGKLDDVRGGTLLTNANHTYVTSTASANNVNYANTRRSIYLPVVRSTVYEVFQVFDFADPSTGTGKRPSTIVAPQALFMMNSALVLDQSRALAEQLLARGETADRDRIDTLYRRAYARPAQPAEIDRALRFVNDYKTLLTAQNVAAGESLARSWQALVRTVISSNEFVYVE